MLTDPRSGFLRVTGGHLGRRQGALAPVLRCTRPLYHIEQPPYSYGDSRRKANLPPYNGGGWMASS